MTTSQVFRASHLSQLVLLILLWTFFLFSLIYSFFHPAQLKLILLFGVLVLLLTIWNRSLKIRVDDTGIYYTSGLKTKNLCWSDIMKIDTAFKTSGTTFSKNILIKSNNSKKPDITFNILYFRKKDITGLGRHILERKPNLPINNDFAKLINVRINSDL